MSFKIEDENAYLKYTEIWEKVKRSLNTRFHSQPNQPINFPVCLMLGSAYFSKDFITFIH